MDPTDKMMIIDGVRSFSETSVYFHQNLGLEYWVNETSPPFYKSERLGDKRVQIITPISDIMSEHTYITPLFTSLFRYSYPTSRSRSIMISKDHL